jgi:hypothetical protein
MKIFRWPWTRMSDEEYIARLRRLMPWLERWRFWLILFHGALLALALWLFERVSRVLFGLAQPAEVGFQVAGLAIGAFFGMMFGWFIYGILNSLIGLIHGLRAERLLLDLLDAVRSEDSEGKPAADAEIGDEEPTEDVNRG